jgi:hypothetical protein
VPVFVGVENVAGVFGVVALLVAGAHGVVVGCDRLVVEDDCASFFDA